MPYSVVCMEWFHEMKIGLVRCVSPHAFLSCAEYKHDRLRLRIVNTRTVRIERQVGICQLKDPAEYDSGVIPWFTSTPWFSCRLALCHTSFTKSTLRQGNTWSECKVFETWMNVSNALLCGSISNAKVVFTYTFNLIIRVHADRFVGRTRIYIKHQFH